MPLNSTSMLVMTGTTRTLPVFPSVERQVFCLGHRLKMVEHKSGVILQLDAGQAA